MSQVQSPSSVYVNTVVTSMCTSAVSYVAGKRKMHSESDKLLWLY